MINGPYQVYEQLGPLTPWIPGADLEVACVGLGTVGNTGFSFHWNSNLLLVDAWRVYVSNDPWAMVAVAPWQLQNWPYAAGGLLGKWHEITAELIPAPAVPAGGAINTGWINVANCHAGYVRLAATINAGQVPNLFGSRLDIWFNGVGY